MTEFFSCRWLSGETDAICHDFLSFEPLEMWHQWEPKFTMTDTGVERVNPVVEEEHGTVWATNSSDLTQRKMTINASRRLDLKFPGRNWKHGESVKMFIKFKWNENEYDGNT